MKKKLTIYFAPIEKEIEIPDDTDTYDIESVISEKLCNMGNEITDLTHIDLFEIWKDREV